MQYLGHIFFRLVVLLASLTPFWLLYQVSNVVAFFLHRIVRYRLKVVRHNLKLAESAVSNRKNLERDIYRNLSDIMLESFKGFSIRKSEMKRRHRVINPEILDDLYSKNISAIITTGHYNNWEWGAFSPNFFVNHQVVALYKPLTNKRTNEFILKRRAKFGTVLSSIDNTAKTYKEYSQKTSIFLMAADQSPTKPEMAIWVPFLNQPTPCPHGLERYSSRHELPIIYAHVKRVKRGYYDIELSWLKKEDEKLQYAEATNRYMTKLDQIIRKEPASWLWTHRKWKHINRFDGTYSHEKKDILFSKK